METFGQRLKELRLERNLTQKELAKILQTTDDSIFSWEKNRSQPSLEFLAKICLYFEISADYLIGIKNEI